MKFRKILFCTDFSDNSAPAREAAIEFARAFQGKLCILHVVNPSPLGYPIFEERIPVNLAELQRNIEENVREELDTITKQCGSRVNKVEGHFRTGEPATEIVKCADEISADLIVMGTHGWTGITHMVLGSTAEHVIRTANCPVVTVRVAAKEWNVLTEV